MSGKRGQGGKVTYKKNVRHSYRQPEVRACDELITKVGELVPIWKNLGSQKIVDIITRAMSARDLTVSSVNKTSRTTVIISMPGGRSKILIPLAINTETEQRVRLSLDEAKQIKIIPVESKQSAAPPAFV